MILSESIIVNRAAEDIFAYYVDLTRHPEFIDLLDETEILTEGELTIGSEFMQYGEAVIGGDLKMHSKVTRLKENQQLTTITIDGGNEIKQDFVIERLSDEQSKVTYITKVTPPKSLFGSITSMVGGLVKSKVAKQLQQDLQRFKAIMEEQ